jgi:hypothetical protein
VRLARSGESAAEPAGAAPADAIRGAGPTTTAGTVRETSTVPSATTSAAPTTTEPPTSTTASTTTEPPPETTTSNAAPETTEPPPTSPPGGDGVVTVICRESWGARAAEDGMQDHTIERLTVHHTAAFLGDNGRAPAMVRGHQRFHIDDRGWPDLAYHYIIDAKGYAYEGRDTTKAGDTATRYDPAGHFLVCCEGNFDDQSVPEAQLGALVDVLAWAAARFGVGADAITGHRDHAATTCPGSSLYSTIEDGTLRKAVVARLAAGPPELRVVCGEEGDALVADIEAGRA